MNQTILNSRQSNALSTEDPAIAADWRNSAALRSEFGTFEVYSAYRRAEAAGKIRVSGQRRDPSKSI